ncbi:hypothetical protein LC613_36210 [Nostoc sphaeroides CHAB 2801]|uniref:hypothetical protein n=1 Tax=Nostoc sphaeroides TaxID=446679 RepID=UPI001E4F4F38|nr:hypothetical protein [Nostoc sphaeroides]MCC5632979.1 hypothetical protein [Nostoc sphaeroides CHAB 2801]
MLNNEQVHCVSRTVQSISHSGMANANRLNNTAQFPSPRLPQVPEATAIIARRILV